MRLNAATPGLLADWGTAARGPPRAARPGAPPSIDTLRLRLLKIAARIVEMKTKIKVHLPSGLSGPSRPGPDHVNTGPTGSFT